HARAALLDRRGHRVAPSVAAPEEDAPAAARAADLHRESAFPAGQLAEMLDLRRGDARRQRLARVPVAGDGPGDRVEVSGLERRPERPGGLRDLAHLLAHRGVAVEVVLRDLP